jgi:hypothetical protein
MYNKFKINPINNKERKKTLMFYALGIQLSAPKVETILKTFSY